MNSAFDSGYIRGISFLFFKTLVYSGKKLPKSRHLSGENAFKWAGKTFYKTLSEPCPIQVPKQLYYLV